MVHFFGQFGLIPMHEPFLSNHGQVEWWHHPSIVQHFCEFNLDSYRDELFDSLGVYFPDTVKKSVVKRRAEFLAGRYCSLKALGMIGEFPDFIPVGKQREPVWPEGVLGAISHTTACATTVVTNDPDIKGLGIDIENLVNTETMEKICSHIMPLEAGDILEQDGLTQEEAFTLIFSLKESFFKAAYPQVKRYFDFNAVKVLSFDVIRQEIEFEVAEDLCPSIQPGMKVDGYYHKFSPEKWATLVCI